MTPRVVVVGSANVDRTILVDALPAPGETVLAGPAARGPGGKGLNQAVAAARMGVSTAFVGAIGDDPDGDFLEGTLERETVDTTSIVRVGEPSGLAVVLLEPDGSNRIVVSPGANDRVDPTGIALTADDVVVLQLEIPIGTVATTLRQAAQVGAVTVLNAAPARTDLRDLLPLVDLLVVNEPELAAIGVSGAGDGLIDTSHLSVRRAVVVTRGPRGATVTEARSGPVSAVEVAAPEVDVVDTTGAGDCFVGVLAAACSVGAGLHPAVVVAVEAASLSVQRRGAAASMPSRSDLSGERAAVFPEPHEGRGERIDDDGPSGSRGTGL